MTGIILLAAGESKRLGRPKQLIMLEGQPLLRRMAEVALQAALGGPVMVVLGAVDQPCQMALEGLEVSVVHNPDWQSGMGGSISAGLAHLPQQDLTGVILMLCDQPRVTPDLLQSLLLASPGKNIVATRCEGHLGPPAWFSSAMFPDLLLLSGTQQGAKALMAKESSIAWLDFPDAAFDIDSLADLLKINS
jgi:molybdenum cofactor cytidylyltransferase